MFLDRNPEPGDNPLLFSTDSKGSFRCTQPQTVMHTTKPLLNQLATGICPHRSNQPTQDSNPGPSDHESPLALSEDAYSYNDGCELNTVDNTKSTELATGQLNWLVKVLRRCGLQRQSSERSKTNHNARSE